MFHKILIGEDPVSHKRDYALLNLDEFVSASASTKEDEAPLRVGIQTTKSFTNLIPTGLVTTGKIMQAIRDAVYGGKDIPKDFYSLNNAAGELNSMILCRYIGGVILVRNEMRICIHVRNGEMLIHFPTKVEAYRQLNELQALLNSFIVITQPSGKTDVRTPAFVVKADRWKDAPLLPEDECAEELKEGKKDHDRD